RCSAPAAAAGSTRPTPPRAGPPSRAGPTRRPAASATTPRRWAATPAGGRTGRTDMGATVLIAGAGNIGSHLAPLLARAGGEGLVGRVQVIRPGDQTACLECAWGEADYRHLAAEYPCRPGDPVTTPSTMAPACVGAVVAGIMAARFLSLMAGEAPAESSELA